MSWDTVSDALQTRLTALFPLAKVHRLIRNTRFDANHEDFQEVYVSCGLPKVEVLQLTRTAFRQTKSTDDDSRWLTQHDVTIHFHVGLQDCEESELCFQSDIEAICDNLRTGDKTLGGVAHTLSDPQTAEISHAMLAEQILCHYAPIKFTVEEVQ